MRRYFVAAALLFALVILAPGPASAQANRFSCPLQKPQKVYGHAINAKTVIEADETWTPNNVYLVFGPFHVKGSLTIQAGTSVCFDYRPPRTGSYPEPPPRPPNSEAGSGLHVLGPAHQY